MLEAVTIEHLSHRHFTTYDIFNIVWSVSDEKSLAYELSQRRTRKLLPTLVLPALDPDNYQDDDYHDDKYDLVRMVGINDNYVTFLDKHQVFWYFEYVCRSPVVTAVIDELITLQLGGSLNYIEYDDCVFFSHLDTLRNYWH